VRNKSQHLGTVVLIAGLATIATSAAVLLLTGSGEVRYSADHGDTMPFWHRWVPALVGIALIRLMPPRTSRLAAPGAVARPTGILRIEALALLATAVLFAVALRLAGGGEPAHTLLKLPLLLGVPMALFWAVRRRSGARKNGDGRGLTEPWRRWGPAVPVSAWLVLAYASPVAVPASGLPSGSNAVSLVATVVIVFTVNSLLEEAFYRRWLQTRWEALLGAWPGVVLASLLWAVWHVGIQGTDFLPVDLARAVVNQGVQGLFLGYLWSRYRMMWPNLAVHGAINAASIVIALLQPEAIVPGGSIGPNDSHARPLVTLTGAAVAHRATHCRAEMSTCRFSGNPGRRPSDAGDPKVRGCLIHDRKTRHVIAIHVAPAGGHDSSPRHFELRLSSCSVTTTRLRPGDLASRCTGRRPC
jgi:membrane protease YdiL (CAAX protease family)